MKQDGQAPQEEEHHVKDVRGEPFAGNHRGLSRAGLLERVRVLEQQVAEIPSLEIKVGSLEDCVSSLTCSLDVYNPLRNRFISAFKRDKLGNATDRDREIIGAGNRWARKGDAVADAQLYQGPNGRRDFPVFKKLYGLLPETVQTISE